MINATGTPAQPVAVQAFDNAHPPVLSVSVDLQGASYVQLSHLVVQSPVYSGFVIRRGSHHITVADSQVSGAPAGINISDGAGTGNAILRNVIQDSSIDGIGVGGVNADPADPTLIQNNTVVRSGVHGIEINGSNYVIEHNNVSYSGQTSGGTSGIHLYRSGPTDIAVSGNLIRYNYSYLNADTVAADGNGIEVDQYCDGNTVVFNAVWGNDGAGIIVYDANDNKIYANTSRDNGHDSGHTHGSGFGELIISSSGIPGRPAGNTLYDNVMVSTHTAVMALWVDTLAVAAGSNRVGPNLMYNTVGGPALRWTNSAQYTTAAQINTVTQGTGNLVALPAFVDVTQPLADGLRLGDFPGAVGTPLTGQTDLLGQPAQAGWANFGAYFTAP
jgi:parallel beta-helix repeat protein